MALTPSANCYGSDPLVISDPLLVGRAHVVHELGESTGMADPGIALP